MGLQCLEQLRKHGGDIPIYVIQNGKSPESKQKFSNLLGSDIIELDYPEDQPGEHYAVIEYLLKKRLPDEEGLWFLDHDAFIQEDASHFFTEIDRTLSHANTCMFTPDEQPLTIPAFWISPRRFPSDCPSLSPFPPKISAVSKNPGEMEKEETLTTPVHDTLVVAQKFLAENWQAALFPLAFFPEHYHLGGLHSLLRSPEALLEQAKQDKGFDGYLRSSVTGIHDFFSSCRSEWLEIEDGTILQKLEFLRKNQDA